MEKYQRHPNTNCASCKKPIYRRPCEIKRSAGNSFCSKSCLGTFLAQPLICTICGKQYPRHYNNKTCSRACANKNRSGIKYKVNRPKDKVVYMDGLKIRLMIERGKKCERCKYPKVEILVIHHKNKDRTNNDLNNLELLCPNCHAEEHYLEKSWYKRYNIEQYKEKLLLKESSSIMYLT